METHKHELMQRNHASERFKSYTKNVVSRSRKNVGEQRSLLRKAVILGL